MRSAPAASAGAVVAATQPAPSVLLAWLSALPEASVARIAASALPAPAASLGLCARCSGCAASKGRVLSRLPAAPTAAELLAAVAAPEPAAEADACGAEAWKGGLRCGLQAALETSPAALAAFAAANPSELAWSSTNEFAAELATYLNARLLCEARCLLAAAPRGPPRSPARARPASHAPRSSSQLRARESRVVAARATAARLPPNPPPRAPPPRASNTLRRAF